MIKAIEGIVTKKEPTFLILKTQSGVSYGIFVSLFTYSKIDKSQKIELLITQIIREDANLLYGFLDLNEQKMFEMLIKLNGIGASTAMAVCSSLSVEGFSKAIMNANTEIFKSVPGIGPKTARRIIAELSDSKLILDATQDVDNSKNEAMIALESLGFKKDKISKVLSECKSKETGDIVKEALQILGKGVK